MADAGKRKKVSGFMDGAGKRAGTYRVFSTSLETCCPQVGGKLRHRAACGEAGTVVEKKKPCPGSKKERTITAAS